MKPVHTSRNLRLAFTTLESLAMLVILTIFTMVLMGLVRLKVGWPKLMESGTTVKEAPAVSGKRAESAESKRPADESPAAKPAPTPTQPK